MDPNPYLKRLGFAPDDRVVILHTDDIGMCQASVAAFADLFAAGIVSSGAVMVPCPWFLEAARFAREHPLADLGVHLTLTSEWETYRWGPVSTREPDTGLLDSEGCFPHRSQTVWESAQPVAAQIELEAQIKHAIRAGVRPTHIDTHMGAVANVKFMEGYVSLAWAYHLPPMVPRLDEAGFQARGMDSEGAMIAARYIYEQEASGLPLIDHLEGMPLDSPEDRMQRTKQALAALEPGLTHFIIHPAADTPELRAITPDWACRAADYQDFLSKELGASIKQLGLQVIGYRAIQNVMPKG
jgi:predicted glycoside hydrolase/deacetylase ChbG (UPF0249 family)